MEFVGKYPTQKLPGMRVWHLLAMRKHLEECHKCDAISEAVNRMNEGRKQFYTPPSN